MARLFIRHKPVENPVDASALSAGSFHMALNAITDAGLSYLNNDMDFVYVCIVDKGKCWAARAFHVHASATRVRVDCVPFDEDPSGQQMILADMILN